MDYTLGNQYSTEWNKDSILEAIDLKCKEFILIHKRVPTRKEWDEYKFIPSRRTSEKYVGESFNNILTSLGYEPVARTPRRYTNRELLEFLRRFFDENMEKPTAQIFQGKDNDYPNPIIYQRRFGTWSNAMELAGFKMGQVGYSSISLPELEILSEKASIWSKEEEDFLRDNYQKISNEEIAQKLNRSNDAIKKRARVLGLTKTKVNFNFKTGVWGKEEEELLRESYQKKSYQEIADMLNRSYNSVKVRAKVLGLTKDQNNPFSCIEGKIWTESEVDILKQEYSHNPRILELLPRRKYSAIVKKANLLGLKMRRGSYSVDSRFFEELNEESAYLAGFIAADGYISEEHHFIEITLSAKERDYLQFIVMLLESNVTVYSDQVRCRIKIVNHKLVDDLVKLGIGQKKSLTLKFPDIPHELHKHFIRGYIDGDGSINPTIQNGRLGLLGTKEFLTSVRDIFFENCEVGLNNLDKKGNIFDLRYHGSSAEKVLDWLYEGVIIYLARKYEKYKDLKRKRNSKFHK